MTPEAHISPHEELDIDRLMPPSAGLDFEAYKPYEKGRFEGIRRGARRVLDIIMPNQNQEEKKSAEKGAFRLDKDGGVLWTEESFGDRNAIQRIDGLVVVAEDDGTYKNYDREITLTTTIDPTALDPSIAGTTDKEAVASFLDKQVPIPPDFVRKDFDNGPSISLEPLDSRSGKLKTLLLCSRGAGEKVCGLGFRKGLIDKLLKDTYRELVITKRGDTYDIRYLGFGRPIYEMSGVSALPVEITKVIKRLPADIKASILEHLEV